MAGMSTPHRSQQRTVSMIMRGSEEDRLELHSKAQAAGMRVQDYMYKQIFGRARDPRVGGRPPKTEPTEELPLTG